MRNRHSDQQQRSKSADVGAAPGQDNESDVEVDENRDPVEAVDEPPRPNQAPRVEPPRDDRRDRTRPRQTTKTKSKHDSHKQHS